MNYNNITDYELITAYPTPGLFFNPEIKQDKIDEYVELYNKYNKIFIQYLLYKTDLKNLDEQMLKQKHIKPLDKSQMDIYQYCISDELKYLYIRNNMHVGRLSEAEKEFLKNIDVNKEELTQKEIIFIKRTFHKVISEGEGKGENLTNFGNQNVGFLAKDNSVVIGIRYEVENPNNMEQVLNAKSFCKLIIAKINFEEGSKLGTPMIGNRYSRFGVNIMLQEYKKDYEKETQ